MAGSSCKHLNIDECLRNLWEFLAIEDQPSPSQAIFVFGRDDFLIPKKALVLYEAELSPVLVLLGGRGRLSGRLTVPESEAFRGLLSERGVPEEAILAESSSTNTGENVDAGLQLLREKGLSTGKIILVTHGPHARRALASARIRAPQTDFLSCPDDCVLPEKNTPARAACAVEMLGEVERLLSYSELGYIEKQTVPPDLGTCASHIDAWLQTEHGSIR